MASTRHPPPNKTTCECCIPPPAVHPLLPVVCSDLSLASFGVRGYALALACRHWRWFADRPFPPSAVRTPPDSGAPLLIPCAIRSGRLCVGIRVGLPDVPFPPSGVCTLAVHPSSFVALFVVRGCVLKLVCRHWSGFYIQ